MRFDTKARTVGAAAAGAVLIIAASWNFAGGGLSRLGLGVFAADSTNPYRSSETSTRVSGGALSAQSVELSEAEIQSFNVEPVPEHLFTIERETVGNIAFNDEMSTQVFPSNQGKIIALFAKAGDDVKKGTPLFTIDSPDLVQAESSLIATAGTLSLTTRVLERAKQLYAVHGIAQKDLDQATADHQAAEGALKAARDAVRILGKTDAEMDRIIAERKVDSVLLVRSPILGRVTARSAAPGLLVQPGTPPAPYTVSDISTVWMLASVPESDIPLMRLGEEVKVTVKAYPSRVYRAKIINIGATVDPAARRILVRSVVRDPKHELRPGMFATFVIQTGQSQRSPAVPFNGVVREGDGTMTVWVTTDNKNLVKRTVKVGLQQNGTWQILEGLKPGELVATEGAIFLNNALTEASR